MIFYILFEWFFVFFSKPLKTLWKFKHVNAYKSVETSSNIIFFQFFFSISLWTTIITIIICLNICQHGKWIYPCKTPLQEQAIMVHGCSLPKQTQSSLQRLEQVYTWSLKSSGTTEGCVITCGLYIPDYTQS
jgi:hypothetical protein